MTKSKKAITFIALFVATLICAPSVLSQDVQSNTTTMTEKELKAQQKQEEKERKEREKAEKKAEKEKQKKEKEPFDWNKIRPALSGMENMDTYILSCDTIWNRIQEYKESITFFKLDTVYRYDKDSGETIMLVKILDEEKKPKNFGRTLLQGLEMTLSGTGIILDVASITLLTASAGTDLVANPLLAFTHTKCLKGGPQIVALAYSEVKDIVNATKAQMADIKSMKGSMLEGSTNETMILPLGDNELPDNVEILDFDESELGGDDDFSLDDLPEFDEMDLKPVETPKS